MRVGRGFPFPVQQRGRDLDLRQGRSSGQPDAAPLPGGERRPMLQPDPVGGEDRPLSSWMADVILPLARQTEEEQRDRITRAWRELGGAERLLFNKLITGAFRVGVSQQPLGSLRTRRWPVR